MSVENIAGGGSLHGLRAADVAVPMKAQALAPDGSIYFNATNVVCRITPAGLIEHVAGAGVSGAGTIDRTGA